MTRLPICILAGTRRHYERWLAESGYTAREAVCVLWAEQLQGMEYRRIIALPGFWDHHEDSSKMYALALTRCRPRDEDFARPTDYAWHRAASGRD